MDPAARRRLLAAVLALLLGLSPTLPAGAGGASHPEGASPLGRPGGKGRIVKTRKIAPGLLFTRIIEKKVPRRTFILKIDPARPLTVDFALAGAQLPTMKTTSQIAERAGALAAVNGDFGSSRSRPAHVFAQDGDLVQTSTPVGHLFALRADEEGVFVGRPALEVSVSNRTTDETLAIDRWNQGPPLPGEIVGFSPVGGTLEEPTGYSCSLRLLPEGDRRLEGVDVVRDYVVQQAACTEAAMSRNGGVVLSATPATDEATELLALAPGTPMELRWSLGWEGVLDAIGGMPVLVQDGQVVDQACSGSFCGPGPRTAIGWMPNGRILLVVVDGRDPDWSVGYSLEELARFMQRLGAVQAVNLDGGGSSTMVVEGEVRNRPSDGRQRRITNAVLVLPGADPGEGS